MGQQGTRHIGNGEIVRREPTLGIIIRHFPANGRLSGLVSFSRLLISALSKQVPIKVFADSRYAGNPAPDGLHIEYVKPPYWVNVWRVARRNQVESLLVISGIHRAFLVFPLLLLALFFGPGGLSRVFVQAVNLDRAFGRATAWLLSRFGGLCILNPDEAKRCSVVFPALMKISPGVSLSEIAASIPWSREAPFRVGFFGHMNRVKGADRALSIICAMTGDEWDAIMSGTGDMLARVQKESAHLDVRIHVMGYMNDPIPALKSCDVLLAPFRESRSVLGYSQVVLEALACGVVVVGARTTAVSAAVRDGVEGFICDSEEEMLSRVEELRRSATLLQRMSENAFLRAREFDVESSAMQLLAYVNRSQ